MKKSAITLLTLIASLTSANFASAGDKICMQNRDGGMTNTPCIMGPKAAQEMFMDMMLHNTEGYAALVSPRNQERLEMEGLIGDTVRATALQHGKSTDGRGLTKTVIQFEVAMDDCGTTDTCGTKFIWTATLTLEADGYSTDRTFTNRLTEVKKFPLWVKGAQNF